MMQYNRKSHILEVFGREPENMDELAQCVIKVIDKQRKVVGFAWDLRHGDVRNTHSCPVGGRTNWGAREKHLPTSYPGWSGRVWIRYEKYQRNGFCDEPFGKTLTHPGTGGGGSYNGPFQRIIDAHWKLYRGTVTKDDYPSLQTFSWDYHLFDSDWPLVTEWVRQENTFKKLSGLPLFDKHEFEWQDPETLAKDAEFITYSRKQREDIKF